MGTRKINHGKQDIFNWINAGVQTIIGIVLIFVTCQLTSTANRLTESSNEIQVEAKKLQVKPFLDIQLFVHLRYDTYFLIGRINNNGLGVAKDIAFLYENEKERSSRIRWKLYPRNTFPPKSKPSMEECGINDGYVEPLISPINFLKANEELEFMLCYSKNADNIRGLSTFYVSYYDIDNNEYMSIINRYCYDILGEFYLTDPNGRIWDSLKALKLGNSKLTGTVTYENTNFRKTGSLQLALPKK